MTAMLAILVAAFLMSALLVRGGIAVARRVGFLSHPNPIVASHEQPVALGGGAALVATILVVCLPLVSMGWLPVRVPLGILLVFGLGLMDDILALRPLPKLAIQGLIALIYLSLAPVPLWSLPLWVLFLLGAQNSWNLIDVMDGLLASVAAACLLAVACMIMIANPPGRGLAMAAAAGSAAAAGFLVWNAHPARVYLGDAGSLSLGMLFGVVVVEVTPLDPRLLVPMLVAGLVPCFEMIFLMVERTKKGIPFYAGSPDHFALRLLHKGYSVRFIVRRVFVASMILAALGVLAAAAGLTSPVLACVTVSVLVAAVRAYRYLRELPVAEVLR